MTVRSCSVGRAGVGRGAGHRRRHRPGDLPRVFDRFAQTASGRPGRRARPGPGHRSRHRRGARRPGAGRQRRASERAPVSPWSWPGFRRPRGGPRAAAPAAEPPPAGRPGRRPGGRPPHLAGRRSRGDRRHPGPAAARAGLRGQVAHTMRAALTAGAAGTDLLITDIGLPDGSGLELVRAAAPAPRGPGHRPERLRAAGGPGAQPGRRHSPPPGQAGGVSPAAAGDQPDRRAEPSAGSQPVEDAADQLHVLRRWRPLAPACARAEVCVQPQVACRCTWARSFSVRTAIHSTRSSASVWASVRLSGRERVTHRAGPLGERARVDPLERPLAVGADQGGVLVAGAHARRRERPCRWVSVFFRVIPGLALAGWHHLSFDQLDQGRNDLIGRQDVIDIDVSGRVARHGRESRFARGPARWWCLPGVCDRQQPRAAIVELPRQHHPDGSSRYSRATLRNRVSTAGRWPFSRAPRDRTTD